MDYKVITNPKNPLCGKSYEEVLEMVKENPYMLRFIQHQTPEVCLAAVEQEGLTLEFIKEQTQEFAA